MKKVVLLLIVSCGLFTPKAQAGPGLITSSVCFQFPQGVCLGNGAIVFTLNTGARAIAGGQVVPTTVTVTLDSTGNIPANTSLYANDQLMPKGTFYNVRIYTSTGTLVSGPLPLIWVIAGASPIDLSLITASSGSPDPGISNPVLQSPAAPQTITGQPLTLTSSAPLTVGAQVTSTVSTGTAPFSIASTTVVPNLNVQLHGGLTAPASAILGLTDTQSPTNKTIDISANTLKTATNTSGHYPRNNGTQYVDSTIAAADLPATTAPCTGVQLAIGLNAGGTSNCATPPTFVASGASHAVGYVPDPGSSAGTTRFLREDATWQAVSGGVSETVVSGTVTSGVCGSGSPSNCAVVFVPANAHTLTRLVSVVTTAGAGCSANSQWAIIDLSNSNAVLASGTPSNIVGTVTDSGALSVAMTAGHRFALGQANNPTGCTTFEAAIISANFQ